MPDRRIEALIAYVLTGVYRDRDNKRKLVLSLSRSALTKVLGGQRLGSAQKEQLEIICQQNGIGLANAGHSFLFFSLEDISEVTASLDHAADDLKKETDRFAKLAGSEAADELYEKTSFPKLPMRRI